MHLEVTRKIIPFGNFLMPIWNEEDRARVGTRLRCLRMGRGLRQEAVAKETGMAIGTVQGIEYNKHKVAVERIDQYAAVFGTTAEELRHPEMKAAIASAHAMENVEIIDGLSDLVFRLANNHDTATPPANWTPQQWAYLKGLASAQILLYRDRLRWE